MAGPFEVGDHVSWNSEAGRIRGTVLEEIVRDTEFKGYLRHASKDSPQYILKSDKTGHIAMHKASALRKLKPRAH